MKSKVAAFVAGVVLFVGLAFQTKSADAAPPFFDPQSVSISESAAQGAQATPKLYASDLEQAENDLTFMEVPASGDGNALFDVTTTGFITLVQANQLDFETKTQYKMDVQAKNSTNETSVATITINITDASDEKPVMNDQTFAVDENKANGSLVGTIVVTDLDASDAAGNAFTFTIDSGNTNNAFTIVNNTREIRVNNSAALNFEVTQSFTLGVTVKDSGQNSDTATITINVNNLNEPPVFVTPLPAPTVSESAPNDTPVGSPVQTTDPDGNSVTYAIVGSTPFKINATTGQIAVANTNQLDHETAPTVKITVRATDNGVPPRSADAEVTITVSDANDPPKASAIPNEVVNQGAGPSNINLRLYFSDDEDTPDELEYSVESNSNPNLFESVVINGNDVLVLTYKANASGKADLVIRAYDTVGAWVEATLTVNINGAPTTSGIANFSVNEDAPDTTIDLWGVFDDDEDDDDELVYAVVSNSNSGLVVTSISGQRNLTLDYVENAFGAATIKVKATDRGGLFKDTTFTVTVNAVNDAPPQLDLNGPASGTGYSVQFNANAGAVIVGGPNMTLVDPDGGNMEAAYIKIANPLDGAAESLDANKTGTAINVSYNASKSTLTLQGPDTIENFIKVLKTVTYDNTAATPKSSTPRQVRFEVYDGQAFSNTATTTVEIIRPQISLSVDKPFQTVVSGGTAIFALTIANTGDIDLANVTLTSPVADCNKGLVKQMLAAGNSLPTIVCSVTNVTQRINNVLKLTAEDTAGGPPVTTEVTAVVRVTNPNIYVEILPDPAVGYTVAKGTDVPLLVIVGSQSQVRLENVTLTPTLSPIAAGDEGRAQDDIDPPANISCNFDVISLNGLEEREFNCTVTSVAAPIAVEVSAVGTIEGTQKTVDDFDRAEINVLDIVIQATSDLFEVPAANATDVTFTITLTNQGNTPVNLTDLTSRNTANQLLHGDLLDVTNSVVKDSTCATLGNAPVLEAGGGTFACSYTASVVAELPLFVNRISFTVADEDANTFSSNRDIEIAVTDETGVRAILNANPSTLLAPGGDIQLLVQIRNNQSSTVSLTGLADSQVGDLNGVGDCAVPQEIAAGESYLCGYKVTRTGLSAGDELKFVLTATVDGDLLTDDVIVRVTERGARRAMLPTIANGAVAGEPNNRSCDAMALMPDMDNYFYADDLDDWYRVDVKSAGPLEVRLKNFKVEGQLIVYIAPNCSAISNEEGKRFSDGSVNNPSKSVILNQAAPGTYFIRVYGSINPSTGQPNTSKEPYVLHIDAP
jgi:hypothetical protein